MQDELVFVDGSPELGAGHHPLPRVGWFYLSGTSCQRKL
jgi:hypothetical protein